MAAFEPEIFPKTGNPDAVEHGPGNRLAEFAPSLRADTQGEVVGIERGRVGVDVLDLASCISTITFLSPISHIKVQVSYLAMAAMVASLSAVKSAVR